MKTKYYSMFGKAKSADGTEHYVTVVGEWTQDKVRLPKEISTDVELGNYVREGIVLYDVRAIERTLTLSFSICHPHDTFNKEIGEKIAKRRIKKGEVVGTLVTNNVTMLNEDQAKLNVFGELQYIIKNIDKYLPTESEGN